MRQSKRYVAPAIAAIFGLGLAACAPGSSDGGSDEAGSAVDVSIIYSETGPLAAYGEAYRNGFEAGLDYATDGTGEVDGRELDITFPTTPAMPTRPSPSPKT